MSNDTDAGRGQLVITGGMITIASGDDAIKAEQTIWITGATIDITESVEGIEAPMIGGGRPGGGGARDRPSSSAAG